MTGVVHSVGRVGSHGGVPRQLPLGGLHHVPRPGSSVLTENGLVFRVFYFVGGYRLVQKVCAGLGRFGAVVPPVT